MDIPLSPQPLQAAWCAWRGLESVIARAPERRIADHVEQVIRKTFDEKPCLIRCKSMATCFVPSERVLPLFYAVFTALEL
jgi:hypothetical protein